MQPITRFVPTRHKVKPISSRDSHRENPTKRNYQFDEHRQYHVRTTILNDLRSPRSYFGINDEDPLPPRKRSTYSSPRHDRSNVPPIFRRETTSLLQRHRHGARHLDHSGPMVHTLLPQLDLIQEFAFPFCHRPTMLKFVPLLLPPQDLLGQLLVLGLRVLGGRM